jgi:biotin operon repressor
MEQKAIERLEAKSAEEAIINQISRDFNLAPFMARTYFQQMQAYFECYLGRQADIGQMTFLAVSADSPPGQPVAACQQVTITLTLDCPDDLVVLGQGLAELRRSKIERLTQEAQEQGALLTQEDLARLLCTSRSTIKRDIAQLRANGLDVPTRGQVKDIGRGLSHKSQIVGDWLAGYTFSQIQKRRWHTLGSIERYCRDFQRVVHLHHHGLSVANIRQSTGLSERLIGEYLALAEAVGPDNDHLTQLLTTPAEATRQPAEIKRGAWLT